MSLTYASHLKPGPYTVYIFWLWILFSCYFKSSKQIWDLKGWSKSSSVENRKVNTVQKIQTCLCYHGRGKKSFFIIHLTSSCSLLSLWSSILWSFIVITSSLSYGSLFITSVPWPAKKVKGRYEGKCQAIVHHQRLITKFSIFHVWFICLLSEFEPAIPCFLYFVWKDESFNHMLDNKSSTILVLLFPEHKDIWTHTLVIIYWTEHLNIKQPIFLMM